MMDSIRPWANGILGVERAWSYPVEEDKRRVSLAQEGDKEALASLYREYLPRIYRYVALHLGSWQEAEDVTAEVFIKMVEKINTFQWRGVPFSAWLFRIAHNQVVDHFRKEKGRYKVPLESSFAVQGDGPAAQVDMQLSLEEVSRAMAGLTELERQVLSLRFAADLSVAEVARIMGKKEGAVKALQHSAVVKLRRKVEDKE